MVQGCRPRTQTACTDCALLFVPLHSSARRVLSISKNFKFKLVHKWCTSLFETGDALRALHVGTKRGQKYGFECSCPACAAPREGSDERRRLDD